MLSSNEKIPLNLDYDDDDYSNKINKSGKTIHRQKSGIEERWYEMERLVENMCVYLQNRFSFSLDMQICI